MASGPWDNYKSSSAQPSGPWAKYGEAAPWGRSSQPSPAAPQPKDEGVLSSLGHAMLNSVWTGQVSPTDYGKMAHEAAVDGVVGSIIGAVGAGALAVATGGMAVPLEVGAIAGASMSAGATSMAGGAVGEFARQKGGGWLTQLSANISSGFGAASLGEAAQEAISQSATLTGLRASAKQAAHAVTDMVTHLTSFSSTGRAVRFITKKVLPSESVLDAEGRKLLAQAQEEDIAKAKSIVGDTVYNRLNDEAKAANKAYADKVKQFERQKADAMEHHLSNLEKAQETRLGRVEQAKNAAEREAQSHESMLLAKTQAAIGENINAQTKLLGQLQDMNPLDVFGPTENLDSLSQQMRDELQAAQKSQAAAREEATRPLYDTVQNESIANPFGVSQASAGVRSKIDELLNSPDIPDAAKAEFIKAKDAIFGKDGIAPGSYTKISNTLVDLRRMADESPYGNVRNAASGLVKSISKRLDEHLGASEASAAYRELSSGINVAKESYLSSFLKEMLYSDEAKKSAATLADNVFRNGENFQKFATALGNEAKAKEFATRWVAAKTKGMDTAKQIESFFGNDFTASTLKAAGLDSRAATAVEGAKVKESQIAEVQDKLDRWTRMQTKARKMSDARLQQSGKEIGAEYKAKAEQITEEGKAKAASIKTAYGKLKAPEPPKPRFKLDKDSAATAISKAISSDKPHELQDLLKYAHGISGPDMSLYIRGALADAPMAKIVQTWVRVKPVIARSGVLTTKEVDDISRQVDSLFRPNSVTRTFPMKKRTTRAAMIVSGAISTYLNNRPTEDDQ